MEQKSDRQKLDEIKKKWDIFIQWEKETPGAIWNSNMQHAMAGSMQHCYDLIWMIQKLDEKLPKEEEQTGPLYDPMYA